MTERPSLPFILMQKLARPPAACVNISCACYACAQCMQRALSRWLVWQLEHVRWWAHRHSHSSICWVSSPNQPSWGMLPVVITNMASSCLWNICSTLLNSLACLHRKWRTKCLQFLPPKLSLFTVFLPQLGPQCNIIITTIYCQEQLSPLPSFSLYLSSCISQPTVMIWFYSLAAELVFFKLCRGTTNRNTA